MVLGACLSHHYRGQEGSGYMESVKTVPFSLQKFSMGLKSLLVTCSFLYYIWIHVYEHHKNRSQWTAFFCNCTSIDYGLWAGTKPRGLIIVLLGI